MGRIHGIKHFILHKPEHVVQKGKDSWNLLDGSLSCSTRSEQMQQMFVNIKLSITLGTINGTSGMIHPVVASRYNICVLNIIMKK